MILLLFTREMLWAGLILTVVLGIFTLGKSPVFRVDRAGAAIIGAAATVGMGILSFDEAVAAVDFRTIIILFSMMIIVANFKLAGFFELAGEAISQHVKSKRQLLLAVIMVSGILSAVVINDVLCLLFTPVVILLCKRAGCNPLPYLLGVATASNVGSAATLLGNPQNILIGSLSGMSFFTYFYTAGPVALVGLITIYLVISFAYRRELSGDFAVSAVNHATVHRYLILKSSFVLLLVLAAYVLGCDLALASCLGGAVLLVTRRIKPNKVYANIDFNLLIMFVGLFVIVAGVGKSGLINLLLAQISFAGFTHIGVFAAVTLVLSNLVSNVPAVLLMKFFVPTEQAVYWWKALAIFSTLAGNLTISGSVANLIVIEKARHENLTITAWDYIKVGVPLTLLTILTGIIGLAVLGL